MTAAVENPLRFPGQYYDAESNLHYNTFRDYDPQTGRYVESDPIGLEGGINTYIYANASPLVWIDLLGLSIECKFFPYSDKVNKGKATGRTRETWFSHIDETIISLPHPVGLPGAPRVMWKIKYTQKGILEAEYEAFQNSVTTCYDDCGNIVDKYWDRKKFYIWDKVQDIVRTWFSDLFNYPNPGWTPDDFPDVGGSPPTLPPPLIPAIP